ncbi:signal transduction histidine kinase [Fictibacillus barbaricus]|uniref:histidine kinase n=2 Tax=Fictibacillus barbaricus TaxID=182136 RepID=A0ABU1U251_9BACL|nr:signal transduction histidine kinase [Fictibacillus barbaricus]
MIRIISPESQVINSAFKETNLKLMKPIFHVKEDFSREIVGNHKVMLYHLPINSDGHFVGSIEIAQNLDTLYDNMTLLMMILLGTTILAILLSFIAGRLLANILLRPISSMSQTMSDIQHSGEFIKIPILSRSKDELTMMTGTFNHMIGQLESNFEKQQQFLEDASHELKTPLTIVDSYTKLLKRWGSKEPAILSEAIDAIHLESQRMKDLINQLLAVAHDNEEVATEKIQLVPYCEKLIQPFIRSTQRMIMISSSAESISCYTDPPKLEQLLRILIDNAIKYSENEIHICIQKQKNIISITIKDEGVGIPADDLPHVFERFYRIDKSRHRATGGSGLGLSIAKSIAKSLRGTITVESIFGKGTNVQVNLPSIL